MWAPYRPAPESRSRGLKVKKLRILMLEADDAAADATERELRDAGIDFDCVRAETRPEFECRLLEKKPDLVLSEYRLPDFDGMRALAMTLETAPGVPFVFVSSVMGDRLAVEAVRAGAFGYVLKTDLSRLPTTVREVVRESEERDGRRRAEERLTESERRLRSILDSVATGVVIIDPRTHRVVDANEAALQMIGSRRERVIGEPCHGLVCPARDGECPVTDLGHELDRAEMFLTRASGETLTVLKTVTNVVLGGDEHLLESFVDITAKKQMEEALRDSEQTARTLMNVPIGSALMIDTEGYLIAISDAGAEKMGRSPEEILGANLVDIFPEEDLGDSSVRVREVIRTGKPVRYDSERAGEFFDNYVFPLFGPTGKVNRVVMVAQDITERKRVEEAQKKDRDFISKVINTAGAMVMVREAQGRIVLFNRTAEEITGYRFEEVAGKRAWDTLVEADDAKRSRAVFQGLLTGVDEAGEEGYEESWRTRGGERRLLSLSNATLVEAGGKVEYVITTGIDVTESRRAEEMLKESEERYRTVFESTGTAMCIVDRDANLTFLNQEFERITGYGAEKAAGRGNFVDFLTAESAESFREHHQGLLNGGRDAPAHFECDLHSSDGNVLKMLISMGFMPGLDATVVSLIDVTRERAYEEDLKERAERLRDFLVVASHELRHPITIVKGYASILSAHIDRMPPEQVHDLLQDVTMSTDRLTRYVEQLLDLSRIEQGRLVIEKQPVEMRKVLETALEGMRVMGVESELVLRASGDPDVSYLDPEKFIQLLNILLDNAVKFSPPGSPVEIDAGVDRDMMVVSVLDRGEGIPEEARERVFDRFYQVEDAEHHSKAGLGFGLYIARQIAEAHGGRIWVEPRAEGGSIFRFAVNVKPDDGDQEPGGKHG